MRGTSMGQQMPPAYTLVVASGPLPVCTIPRSSHVRGGTPMPTRVMSSGIRDLHTNSEQGAQARNANDMFSARLSWHALL
jgi:hypothetical protein